MLPAQLDVNIPLVSYDIPTVEVGYRADGVYQTFSKYMDETTLKQTGAFKIDGQNATVELLNSEPVPANINYAGEVSSYTSQVKLSTGGCLSGKVTIIIGNGVLSYTGVPCTTSTEGMTLSSAVEEASAVETPTFSPTDGQVAYGSTVTITCATDGAVLCYTTDGITPTTSSPSLSAMITNSSAPTPGPIPAAPSPSPRSGHPRAAPSPSR